jgi:hypothetical protein
LGDEKLRSYYGTAISKNLGYSPEGFLICRNCVVARTAVQTPQMYAEREVVSGGSNRQVPVYRPRESVFDPAYLASLEGKILTSPHPPTFLGPQNAAAFGKGVVVNVRRGPRIDGEDVVLADLIIYDKGLIDEVVSGKIRQLSVGYDCVYVPHDDDEGLEQRHLVANHVAIVHTARAGPAARIYDSEPDDSLTAEERDAAEYALAMKVLHRK